MASYLDFEKGIQQIDEDIANAKIKGDEHAIEILSKNLEKEIAKTFNRSEHFIKQPIDYRGDYHMTKEERGE